MKKRVDSNRKHIEGFVKRHKDELVLDGFDVVRLIGWENVPNDDYYWKVRLPCTYPFTGEKKKEIRYTSCVGDLVPLKNSITPNEYKRLDRYFKLNEYVDGKRVLES